jgi:hypothetical protein
MRIRGLILILLSVPGWMYVIHIYNIVKKSPFAYEFGSVAWPTPLPFRVVGIFAELSLLIGALLLAFDFIRWIKRRS